MKPVLPLKRRLEKIRSESKLPWEGLERDYLFSWILSAMAADEALGQQLVFKGGACLKKCYFGCYRFSEDLDFTKLPGALKGAALEDALKTACKRAETSLSRVGDVKLECSRYVEKEAHPHGQEAFTIRGKMPWHSSPTTRVKIEITQGEEVLVPPQARPLLHEYGDELEGEILTYALEEIVAEKLRAILQQVANGYVRGWIRPRPRDYYDLWRILTTYPSLLDTPNFVALLRQKCAAKEVAFVGPESFFPEIMIREVEKNWSNWMRPLVGELSSWSQVFQELQPLITKLLHK